MDRVQAWLSANKIKVLEALFVIIKDQQDCQDHIMLIYLH